MKIKVIFGTDEETVVSANCETTLRSVCTIGSYPLKNAEYTINGRVANLDDVVKDGDTVTVDYKDGKLG